MSHLAEADSPPWPSGRSRGPRRWHTRAVAVADERAPVLRTEGRVTMIDGILASAVLLGLVLNAALGWWWADPAAGYVLVYYAGREVREIFVTPGG